MVHETELVEHLWKNQTSLLCTFVNYIYIVVGMPDLILFKYHCMVMKLSDALRH